MSTNLNEIENLNENEFIINLNNESENNNEYNPTIISINVNGFSIEKVYELTESLSEDKNKNIKIILLQHIDISKKNR